MVENTNNCFRKKALYSREGGKDKCPSKYDTNLRLPLNGVFAIKKSEIAKQKLGSTLNV